MKRIFSVWTLVLPALVMLGCAAMCSSGEARLPETVAPSNILRAAYACPFSEAPVTVDGVLNEPVWDKAKTISFVLPVSFKAPISKTEAKIAYDKKFLYVAFKAYDEDVWGLLTERDSTTFTEDVLEVFFKTDPAKDPYFNFEMGVQGAVMDAYNLKRGAAGNYKRWSQWDCKGLQMASKVKGTVNNWADRDEYWILEVAVPFAEIPTLGGKSPVKGDKWLFNLARYDYSIYLPEGCELSAGAHLSVVNFHWYEDWSELIFN